MMRKRMFLWILFLALACSACADGGSRGTGISTAQGNVESVQTASLPHFRRGWLPTVLAAWRNLGSFGAVAAARAELEGIVITVEGRGARGETNSDGSFSVRGDFEGYVSLLFERADDGLTARLPINIPASGTLTLNNVHIDGSSGIATAQSQSVDFEGVFTDIDCTGKTITLVSAIRRSTDTGIYTVRLDNSSLRDSQGNPIGCQSLEEGQRARVTGSVDEDGTFGDAVVQLEE